jgi:ribosomal protein S18 acetylase RimI-like enzyme
LTSPPHISIHRASASDAERLSTFAARTFHDAFGAENTPDNMQRYVAEAFSVERQSAEIADPAGIFLLAERTQPAEDEPLVGYARLVSGPPPASVDSPAIELRRLYVDRGWHGAGVAQALIDAVLESARHEAARTVWLAVWERNARAIRFYEKCGFVRIGTKRFLLGDDEQTDWLMARPV